MLEGDLKGTGKTGPTTSIMDTVAIMLGFAPLPISPGKMSIGSSPADVGDVKDHKPTPNQECKPAPIGAFSSTGGGEDQKPPPPVVSSDGLVDSNAIPMEIFNTSRVAVNPKASKAPLKDAISSPDSDSEESIPDAIAFKSSK
jgi:hypothetical protein